MLVLDKYTKFYKAQENDSNYILLLETENKEFTTISVEPNKIGVKVVITNLTNSKNTLVEKASDVLKLILEVHNEISKEETINIFTETLNKKLC